MPSLIKLLVPTNAHLVIHFWLFGYSEANRNHASANQKLRDSLVKPPNSHKITKTPINTGDLYFQNLAVSPPPKD